MPANKTCIRGISYGLETKQTHSVDRRHSTFVIDENDYCATKMVLVFELARKSFIITRPNV